MVVAGDVSEKAGKKIITIEQAMKGAALAAKDWWLGGSIKRFLDALSTLEFVINLHGRRLYALKFMVFIP